MSEFPVRPWNGVPFHGVWHDSDGSPVTGTIEVTLSSRITRADGRVIYPGRHTRILKIGSPSDQDPDARAAVRAAWKAADAAEIGASFDPVAWDRWWDTKILPAAIFGLVPASDDPDITPQGWQIRITEKFESRQGESYVISTPLASLTAPIPGINLGDIDASAAVEGGPVFAKGQPGGIASLDADGRVPQAQLPSPSVIYAGALPAVYDLTVITASTIVRGSISSAVDVVTPLAPTAGMRIDLYLDVATSTPVELSAAGARTPGGAPILTGGAGILHARLEYAGDQWMLSSGGTFEDTVTPITTPSIVAVPAGGSVVVYGAKSVSEDREQLLHLDTGGGEGIEVFRTGSYVNRSGQARIVEDSSDALAGYGYIGATGRNVGAGRLMNGSTFGWGGAMAAAVYPRRLSVAEQRAAADWLARLV